ncbi:HMG-Y-related protein A-like [Ananas comosus]|uniref:HMG-Y-related protein A n=1 Tax=Ananas comosus TaxID=4615 RepID=A0A6P5H5F6_ANACO|nr:HMG-Y-related protein A-like [Ananas comosus]
MATEEVSKPPSLPPYPEMIMAAIAALNETNGSNKSAIAKYIESKYGGELPESHASLLTAHLARMKESGDLLFLKNNYLRPGVDTPPKRGRGRPPKPKVPGSAPAPAAAAAAAASPRPRGRPPKPRDPLAAAAARAAAGMPRPRGRPPKKARAADVSAVPAAAAAAAPGGKRGRGRPPKVKPAVATDEQ